MSEKTERARRQASNGEKPSPAPESIEPGNAQECPGVIILRVPIPDQPGQQELQIIPINGMDPLAVPRLLELALHIDRQQAGLH